MNVNYNSITQWTQLGVKHYVIGDRILFCINDRYSYRSLHLINKMK